jgi:hypothetical protein
LTTRRPVSIGIRSSRPVGPIELGRKLTQPDFEDLHCICRHRQLTVFVTNVEGNEMAGSTHPILDHLIAHHQAVTAHIHLVVQHVLANLHHVFSHTTTTVAH